MLPSLLWAAVCIGFIAIGDAGAKCPCTNPCGIPRDPRRSHGSINLAFNRSSIQSTNYSTEYIASKAVNNVIQDEDFSHTAPGTGGWWKVDLGRKYVIGQIELYNRADFYCRLAKITIFTSNFVSPGAPSNSSSYWKFRHYQEDYYGAVGTVTFNLPTEARHVAVYSMHPDGLTLVEVKIYRYNYALHRSASHSGSSTYPASNATDGIVTNNHFSTTSIPSENTNHWWKVKLAKRIFFHDAYIYVRNGSCENGSCESRLSHVSFLTSNISTDISPNLNGTGNWSRCSYNEAARGVEYKVQCDGDGKPVAKEFGIRTDGGISVGLREVEIYGSELPQLNEDASWRVESATMTKLNVSFNTWNDTWTGGRGPTRYQVKCNGTKKSLVAGPLSRISVMFDGLTIKQSYNFTLSCFYDEILCRGPILTFNASTVCEEPSAPHNVTVASCTKTTDEGREKWNCTVTWQASAAANCPGSVIYELVGSTTNQTTSLSTEIYLDGYQQYNICIRAVNADGLSSSYVNISGKAEKLAPQFGIDQFNISPINSTCVSLTWSQPLYPGGPISHYEITCTGQAALTVSNTSYSLPSCNHRPNTPVTCHLKAYNDIPEGSQNQTATKSTLCYVPSMPRNIALTNRIDDNGGRQRWKYTVHWQAPEHSNCGGPIQYAYGINESHLSELQETTSVEFHLDGNQPYNFTVRAHNSQGYSIAAVENGASGKIEPQFGNSQFTAVAASSRCVNLSWTEPQYPGGPITHYGVTCANEGWQNVSHTQHTTQSCEHLPNTPVTCHLKAFNGVAEGSQEKTISISTECAVPEMPLNLSLTSTSEPVSNDGRLMWRYTAQWQEPRKNCNGTLSYKYTYTSSGDAVIVEGQTECNATFYIDGNETWIFAVTANNSIGKSGKQIQAGNSSLIVPQFGSASLIAKGHNSSCIFLTWSEPQFTGGDITGYYVKCQNRPWSLQPELSKLSCGYQPFSEVKCSIKAFNEEGNSTAVNGTGTTNCTVPGTPTNITLKYTNVSRDGRMMLKCTATWKEPQKNCHGQIMYFYEVNGTDRKTTGEVPNATFHLNGYQNFSFTVKANGTKGFSLPGSKSDRSPQLAPQFKPTNVTLVATSPYNVTLTWMPPLYPGGPITHYLCKCSEQNETVNGNATSIGFGGFKPYSNVTCSVKARNDVGFSEVEEKTTTTLCAKPEFILQPAVNDSYDQAKKRRMAVVHVTNENVEVNCRNLRPVQYKVLGREFSTNNTIMDLNATTTYNVVILVTNNDNFSRETYVHLTTGELEPWSPPVIEHSRSAKRSCAVVNWTEPKRPNGVIIQYRYRCTNATKNNSVWINTTSKNLSDCGHEAGEKVTCEIQAATAIGFGPSNHAKVNITCDYPSSPVFNHSSFKEDNATATLTIDLQKSQAFCHSVRYILTVADSNGSVVQQKTSTTHGNYSFLGLTGFTNYTVAVQVINNDNLSRSSDAEFTTVETVAPGVPAQFSLGTTETCGMLIVAEPLKPNGIITNYTFICKSKDGMENNLTAPTPNKLVDLCGFKSATEIRCSAGAHNTLGLGKLVVRSKFTQIKVVNENGSMPEIPKQPANGDTVLILLKPVPIENVNISFYYVLLEKMSDKSRTKRSTNRPCSEKSLSLNASEANRLSETCYTIARLPSEKVKTGCKFEIGDGSHDGNYYNKPLESNAKYNLHIAVTANVSPDQEPLMKFLPPVSFTAPAKQQQKNETSNGAAIGLGVVGALMLAVATIVAVVFVRRRKKVGLPLKESLETDNNAIELESEFQISTATIKRPPLPLPQDIEEEDEEETDIYDNAGVATSEPIPIDKLFWYNKTNAEAIEAQYDDLKKLPSPVTKHALRPENKGKCRYRNLYPSDKHRVKLVREDCENTDFINASFMTGYRRDNQYIAAQGPFTEAVTADFWLMIWQQRPSAIVMVTRTVENTKMKCLQYWPEGDGIELTFEDFKITRTASDFFSDFSVSTLMVSRNGEKRMIPHFNYLTWPDHGVPDIEVFVEFHRMISASISQHEDQPLLVHCSAGVGRTGTYIALDYLLEQAKRESMVDAFSCVAEMRRRRPSMIQTVDQYVLLHHALYESFSTQNVCCPPPELRTRLANHQKFHNTERDLISSEYKHVLERIQSLTFSYASGKVVGNQDENRYLFEILPCEKYILYLSNGANGNYINAVTIDGYRMKKQWISTQIPFSHTIIDFWQLMLEQDVQIIIQLEGSQIPFYPLQNGKELDIDPFIIERQASVDGDVVTTVTICVKKDEEEKKMQVLVVKNWLKKTLPTADTIVSIQQAAERLQQQCGKTMICVTCLDGCTRCGLYICAHNAIEKMKAEQEVNVYYPTVMAKLRRPQFIPTLEQYNFLYQVMDNYMSAFGEYANFD